MQQVTTGDRHQLYCNTVVSVTGIVHNPSANGYILKDEKNIDEQIPVKLKTDSDVRTVPNDGDYAAVTGLLRCGFLPPSARVTSESDELNETAISGQRTLHPDLINLLQMRVTVVTFRLIQ